MLLFYVKTLSSTYKVFFLLILKEIKPFLWVSDSIWAPDIVPSVLMEELARMPSLHPLLRPTRQGPVCLYLLKEIHRAEHFFPEESQVIKTVAGEKGGGDPEKGQSGQSRGLSLSGDIPS